MTKKHVAVLMGGWTSERQVSLWSGAACADALERLGHHVTRIDVDRDLAARLTELKPDVVFNSLHGPFGEDGTVQGILEFLDIPYTHSGVLASALAMNKAQAKKVMAAAGVPIAPDKVVLREEAARAHVMAPPYVVKPLSEGSSFGILFVHDDLTHPPQELFSSDWKFGEQVMVEQFISGREFTCAVMGDRALDVTEIIPQSEFYDFEAKYAPGGSKHIFPAEISPNIYQKIQKLALSAHQALGCRGVSRADFRYDGDEHGSGTLVCLEVNTQPGMTATSLVPELAQLAGYSFEDLVGWMLEDASCGR